MFWGRGSTIRFTCSASYILLWSPTPSAWCLTQTLLSADDTHKSFSSYYLSGTQLASNRAMATKKRPFGKKSIWHWSLNCCRVTAQAERFITSHNLYPPLTSLTDCSFNIIVPTRSYAQPRKHLTLPNNYTPLNM